MSFHPPQEQTASNTSTSSGTPANPQQLIFDFTKRKRWADLLVTELTEAIMLVLSQNCQIWYCGPAIEDLLGWKDEEVVDGNFCDIMNADDRQTFRRQFAESMQNRTDLLAYARLQCKTANDLYPSVPVPPTMTLKADNSHRPAIVHKEILFEIVGYAHYVTRNSPAASASVYDTMGCVQSAGPSSASSSEAGTSGSEHGVFKCFFAMAKPYPSRNTAMLNTFLELKMENERLQTRVRIAREQYDILMQQPLVSQPQQHSESSEMHPSGSQQQSFRFAFTPQSTQPPSFNEEGAYYSYEPPGRRQASSANSGFNQPIPEGEDQPVEGTLPRKKFKKTTGNEMYVCMTCGRTDSPEWRKGPQGPKTLCNACGLRWAKSVRVPKESLSTSTSAASGSSHDVPPSGESATVASGSNSSIATTSEPSPSRSVVLGGAGTPYYSMAYDFGHGMYNAPGYARRY